MSSIAALRGFRHKTPDAAGVGLCVTGRFEEPDKDNALEVWPKDGLPGTGLGMNRKKA